MQKERQYCRLEIRTKGDLFKSYNKIVGEAKRSEDKKIKALGFILAILMRQIKNIFPCKGGFSFSRKPGYFVAFTSEGMSTLNKTKSCIPNSNKSVMRDLMHTLQQLGYELDMTVITKDDIKEILYSDKYRIGYEKMLKKEKENDNKDG